MSIDVLFWELRTIDTPRREGRIEGRPSEGLLHRRLARTLLHYQHRGQSLLSFDEDHQICFEPRNIHNAGIEGVSTVAILPEVL